MLKCKILRTTLGTKRIKIQTRNLFKPFVACFKSKSAVINIYQTKSITIVTLQLFHIIIFIFQVSLIKLFQSIKRKTKLFKALKTPKGSKAIKILNDVHIIFYSSFSSLITKRYWNFYKQKSSNHQNSADLTSSRANSLTNLSCQPVILLSTHTKKIAQKRPFTTNRILVPFELWMPAI